LRRSPRSTSPNLCSKNIKGLTDYRRWNHQKTSREADFLVVLRSGHGLTL